MNENMSIKAKKYKSMSIFIACVVLTLSLFCQASADLTNNDLHKDTGLKIYLPREVTIKDSNLILGRVSIIQGSESLAAKANEIPLGKISLPGQKIVLDRPTILGRLACNGIPISKVTLTGSEKITVNQQNKTISGSDFVSLAESFLEKNPPDNTVCKWNPIREPKDFIVSEGSKDIKLIPRLVQTGVKALVLDGIKPTRETILSGKYPVSRPLFMFTNGYPELGSMTHKFVTFYLTERGQEVIEDKGFVPVTHY